MTKVTNSKANKSKLMAGYKSRQNKNREGGIEAGRWDYPLRMCRWITEDTARRVAASREEFPWSFLRGDCHSHTQHSDGIGTVAETAASVEAAGLDFQFVTDHWGVTQAPECRKHGLWYGQEPATQYHHMGILGLDHAFTPKMDFYTDLAAAAELGATVFVPHPTGWWPRTVYSGEQTAVLDNLPDPFLMEICNGASNIVNAFDYTDDSAIELWDHLLNLGKRVHAMGNTDAHAPHAIGMVWNNVFVDVCEQDIVLAALRAGRSFVSDAPLVHIALGAAEMGQTATPADRRGSLKLTAVDSRGLADVSVVADGEVLEQWDLHGESKCAKSLRIPKSIRRYVRVAVRSRDGRRAYSNPIYFGP